MRRRNGEIHRLESDPDHRDDEIVRLSEEVERLQAALCELRESTSWRITAPMRGLKKAGLRLRSYLSRTIVAPTRARIFPTRADDDVTLILRSGLFDPLHYAAHAADVRERGLDPVVHYITRGAAEGLDPHPLFDSSFYLEQNPDVARSGENPLVHYIRTGSPEGSSSGALLATIGGMIGCLLALPMHGYSTGMMSFDTWGEVAFEFRITPLLAVKGLLFAIFIGAIGSFLPAVRASRLPVIAALRAV